MDRDEEGVEDDVIILGSQLDERSRCSLRAMESWVRNRFGGKGKA